MRGAEEARSWAVIRLSAPTGREGAEAARAALAARLRNGLRADDRARLWMDGDGVQILVAAPADAAGAARLGGRLKARLSEPLRLTGAAERAEARMGWALADSLEPRSWRRAWRAARAAALGQDGALGLLRAALAGDGLALAFQPVVEIAAGRVAGLEALARLTAPGAPGPGVFAPLAEANGLIHALGERAARLAARQARVWGGPRVAVNAAAAQIESPDFAETMLMICAQEGCPPSLLMIEVTESAALAAPRRAAAQLGRLRRAGMTVAIDDFGASHGDFARLAAFPADVLKLDASLAGRAAAGDPHGARILGGLAALARALGMDCVAEGVETRAHLAAVRAAGILRAQGDFYASACDAAAAGRLLAGTPFRMDGF